jgi:hypothetical protein
VRPPPFLKKQQTMDKIIIKQISNPDNPKIPAKYIGAKEYATPKTGKDGKIITGVDENAFAIIASSEPEEVKKKQSQIKKVREELERQLNVDLTPSSDYWEKFFIVLEDERQLDEKNPLDNLHERFLLANRYVAPSRQAIEEDPEYYNCLFYIHRDKEETAKRASGQRKVDKATAKLVDLYDENPTKLQQVSADIFGYEAQEISPDDAYVKLKDFLEVEDKRTQDANIKRFMDTVDKTAEEMMAKKIFDKAIKKKFVTSKGNVYRRGDEIYGNSYEEALEFLLSPENSAELISLQKQVSKSV